MNKLALATAWKPRGEFLRFQHSLPELRRVYAHIAISLPPEVEAAVVWDLEQLALDEYLSVVVSQEWADGRHAALSKALECGVEAVHAVDFDRLLRWVETRPQEWQSIARRSIETDCLIAGRSERAYGTHPQALVQSEAISNEVISFLLGRRMDVSAGSKSFSRQAAEFLVRNSPPGHALGTDGEWPILLQRGGFVVEYTTVDGLDWETADRFLLRSASEESQRKAAAVYDADFAHWAYRLSVAQEIIHFGLEAARRELR